MTMADVEPVVEKRIKFRSISTTADPNYALNRVEDIYLPRPRSKSEQKCKLKKEEEAEDEIQPSLWEFLGTELKRSYALEHDEEHYHARREKVYSFMKIPREVEKFMSYGFMQCADSFMFVYTFLPMRLILALWGLITRPFKSRSRMRNQSLLNPAEICDLLKGSILIICSYGMTYVDTSIMYHLIKSQSIIKLYIFYNMLEVADRLFSAFGQDVIDALYWTSTEPRDRKREHLGTIPHLCFALVYVFLHALLVLCQATTLNVAINSSNKALLTIMMSNNFVELKGSVFKKFDKNNLFQVSCSDVRERFHLFILLFIVVLQTMKEYAWKEETLWILVPDCIQVLLCEIVVDWIKHAFITRFNELPVDVYRDYTLSLAYDVSQTRQKNAYSDRSDLVARRMGFIPLPLGVVMIRVVTTCVKFQSLASILVTLLACCTLFSICVNNNLIILMVACKLIDAHQHQQDHEKEEKSEPCSKDIATSPTRPVSNLKPPEHPSEITNLGSTAIFANSTVSMNDVHLNEEMLRVGVKSLESIGETGSDHDIYRSEPNIQLLEPDELGQGLKRAESEPNIPSIGDSSQGSQL
ncbi:protein TAPT1 homolog isoform X2 [Halyomorpha halys]|uniref:protein TAPT1 homolog isoform X2 n=1 Tax=Halyomorpha halys TaxID=286706 RepID=UPI0006D4EB57|nr:protein TAPT1 homolog isoform X2 [Halyomorpha halys]